MPRLIGPIAPCKHCGGPRHRNSAGKPYCSACHTRRSADWLRRHPEKLAAKRKADIAREAARRRETRARYDAGTPDSRPVAPCEWCGSERRRLPCGQIKCPRCDQALTRAYYVEHRTVICRKLRRRTANRVRKEERQAKWAAAMILLGCPEG